MPFRFRSRRRLWSVGKARGLGQFVRKTGMVGWGRVKMAVKRGGGAIKSRLTKSASDLGWLSMKFRVGWEMRLAFSMRD